MMRVTLDKTLCEIFPGNVFSLANVFFFVFFLFGWVLNLVLRLLSSKACCRRRLRKAPGSNSSVVVRWVHVICTSAGTHLITSSNQRKKKRRKSNIERRLQNVSSESGFYALDEVLINSEPGSEQWENCTLCITRTRATKLSKVERRGEKVRGLICTGEFP